MVACITRARGYLEAFSVESDRIRLRLTAGSSRDAAYLMTRDLAYRV
ncbi:protein of unknown function [Rhodovastum atsumiense]|nr:protein of unknown function [Rhodovastum atsumiense]